MKQNSNGSLMLYFQNKSPSNSEALIHRRLETVKGRLVSNGSIATDVARVKIHRCPLRSESNGPRSKRNLSQRAIRRHHDHKD